MIGAIQTAAGAMQNIASGSIQPSAEKIASAGAAQQPVQQAMEVVETTGETFDAAMGAQASLFREGLDMSVDVAKEVVNMADAAGAYKANAKVAETAGEMLDTVV